MTAGVGLMDIVIITALGVGGATIFGAVIGLICKRTKKKDYIL